MSATSATTLTITATGNGVSIEEVKLPSTKAAYGSGKAAASFQAHTIALVKALGGTATVNKSKGTVTYVVGGKSTVVHYSSQGFVSSAKGALEIAHSSKKKFDTLEKGLVSQAGHKLA